MIVEIDRGFSKTVWLCAACLELARAAGWELKKRHHASVDHVCDECQQKLPADPPAPPPAPAPAVDAAVSHAPPPPPSAVASTYRNLATLGAAQRRGMTDPRLRRYLELVRAGVPRDEALTQADKETKP